MLAKAKLLSLFCLFHFCHLPCLQGAVEDWMVLRDVKINDSRYLTHLGKRYADGNRYVLYITFNAGDLNGAVIGESMKNFINITEKHFPPNKPPHVNGFKILNIFAKIKPEPKEVLKDMTEQETTL